MSYGPKQPEGSAHCLTCCLATLTKCSLESVIDDLQTFDDVLEIENVTTSRLKCLDKVPSNHPLHGQQCCTEYGSLRYLLYCGYRLGIPIAVDLQCLQLHSSYFEYDAILTVKSKIYTDKLHCIVYVAVLRCCFDPSDGELHKLTEFDITSWEPVLKIGRY